MATCACPRKEEFKPRRKSQRYFKPECRQRMVKTVLIRVPVEEAPKIKVRLARQKRRQSVVQRIGEAELAELAQDIKAVKKLTLLLKSRLGEINDRR